MLLGQKQYEGYLITGMAVPCCIMYGAGSGGYDIHFLDVECHGSESDIADCIYSENTVGLSHENDVGVHCQRG